jgi:hypothetical protein
MPNPTTTRLNGIVARVQPLADWLQQNKPSVTTIAVFKKDWLFLVGAPLTTIRTAGFNISKENGVTYGKFRLKPVDQKITKSK